MAATEIGALPDDALANVFRGLPLRSLAVVRCVCKAWRDVVDARALVLRHLHLLPRTVRGVFINYPHHDHPHHFARPCSPSTIPRVDGNLSFLPKRRRRSVSVLDHCNGLLLCGDTGLSSELCVCNPATRRWTVLPRWWEDAGRYAGAYIAFDPAESPQYEVILVPAVPKVPSPPKDDGHRWSAAEEEKRRALLWEKEKDAPFCLDWFFSLPEDGDGAAVGDWEFEEQPSDLQQSRGYMEWPPSPWKLRVFSSSTGQWKDRIFVREGMPAGKVYKVRSDSDLELHHSRPLWRYAVYHHGSLYVHCRGSFLARISLSKSKYQIIETPANVNKYTKPYLGKLQNGVCFGIVQDHQLKIWIINESCGQMEWVLKYETAVGNYAKYLASIPCYHDGSWTVEENVETDHDLESLSEEENIEIQDIDHDDESLESLSDEGNIEIQDSDHDVESLSDEGNIEIQDSDHDVESPSEEQNIDHDVESVSEEENTEIRYTDHDVESTDQDVESISEEENTEIRDTDHDVESLSEEGHEWDSDNDDTFTIKTECQKYFYDGNYLNIIGFHPYKEVVFMVRQFQVVAYHLNSTKIQYLGNSRPKSCYPNIFWDPIYELPSFLYTPCMIGDLLHGDQTGGQTSSED